MRGSLKGPASQEAIPAKFRQQFQAANSGETPASEEETPASQKDTPASQEEISASQKETPPSQEASPASQEDIPASQEETPAIQEETPAGQEAIPASRQDLNFALAAEQPRPRRPLARRSYQPRRDMQRLVRRGVVQLCLCRSQTLAQFS